MLNPFSSQVYKSSPNTNIKLKCTCTNIIHNELVPSILPLLLLTKHTTFIWVGMSKKHPTFIRLGMFLKKQQLLHGSDMLVQSTIPLIYWYRITEKTMLLWGREGISGMVEVGGGGYEKQGLEVGRRDTATNCSYSYPCSCCAVCSLFVAGVLVWTGFQE